MKNTLFASLIAFVALFSAQANAATVSVGNHNVAANSANQTFAISVTPASGIDTVPGVVLNVQIADGGPEAPGGVIDGPVITGFDITGAGTLFAGNNNGQAPFSVLPQVATTGTLANTPVLANGILAFITVNTTGFGPGTYAVHVSADQALGVSNFVDGGRVGDIWIDGSITLVSVPEPTSIVLAAFPAAFGAVLLLRRRRCKA